MPNQTTYYSRMAKSAPDKIAAISTYTKAGTRVLDFGSGLNIDVAEFVSGRGGTYTSVDNNGLRVVLSECHHDDSYDRYFGRLFSHLSSELRDAPSKHVMVFKKA